jgi:UDP-GlcNAc:undecaprenyl-phosphate GlcNAc-1-phosphate transferase
MADYLIVFIVSVSVTYMVMFPVRKLAYRLDIVDYPNERKIHRFPTALGGGAGMLVGFVGAMVVASILPGLHGLFARSTEPQGVIVAAAVMFGVGMIDDVKPVSAPAKIAGQVLASSVLYFMGVTMFYFKIPFAGVVVLSPQWLPLLTALWVVVIANAINFIDGLDGLAAGIVAIGAGSFFLYSNKLIELGSLSKNNIGLLIAVIACGICLGFLPHNFNPAKIMMGDAGALMLGLLMAASTMVVGGRTSEVPGETYFFFAPLFIPFFILGVPIVDTIFAIVRRTAKRSSVAVADRDHLHHRLVRLGHGPRRSVVILWVWTAILSAFVLYPVYFHQGNAFVPFLVAALGILLYTLFHPGLRHDSSEDVEETVSISEKE